jgi:hypothetical protein
MLDLFLQTPLGQLWLKIMDLTPPNDICEHFLCLCFEMFPFAAESNISSFSTCSTKQFCSSFYYCLDLVELDQNETQSISISSLVQFQIIKILPSLTCDQGTIAIYIFGN